MLKVVHFLPGLQVCLLVMTHVLAGRHLAAGFVHSLYLDPAGNVWVWGNAKLSPEIDRHLPHLTLQNARSVFADPRDVTSLVIKQDDSLWGWGDSEYGQPGIIQQTYSKNDGYIRQPRKIMDQVKDVSGDQAIFAIREDDSLWAWGRYGSLRGDTSRKNRICPRKVMDNVAQVSSTYAHPVVKKKDGTVWVWGENDVGQLGNGTTVGSITPVQVHFPKP